MSYRNTCDRCADLEAEVEELKADLLRKKQPPPGMQPFPKDLDPDRPSSTHEVRCPFCTTLYGGEFLTPFLADRYTARITAICIGGRWSCKIQAPHRHRKCSNCGKRWTEHARPEETP